MKTFVCMFIAETFALASQDFAFPSPHSSYDFFKVLERSKLKQRFGFAMARE